MANNEIPKIAVERRWNAEAVQIMCVRHGFYTCGDNIAYLKMLSLIDKMEPTPENLYVIAKDIVKHSIDETITNVMFLLEKSAVNTFYEIEGEEE